MALGVFFALSAGRARAQESYACVNDAPNPYHMVPNWAQLPDGRKWGSTAGVDVGPDGNIWAIDRCGANDCAESKLDPVLEFTPSGTFVKSFGGGLINFPHGIYVDKKSNVWVTDSHDKNGKGQQVVEFSPDGKILMKIGQAGVAGKGPDTFDGPSDVVVAKNGDIFVADGHVPAYDNSRIVKFSKDGKYIMEFGAFGSQPGQTTAPHSLAFDSKGRLFVADRTNNRVSVFDQNGKFLFSWAQFSRPSGIYIDQHDILYVSDSESTDNMTHVNGPDHAYGYNPGCKRGIRIGDVKDGKVTAFIPARGPSPDTGGPEGVAADHDGNVYGAEVSLKDLTKYTKAP